MHGMKYRFVAPIILLLLMSIFAPLFLVLAQDNAVVVSLAIPEYLADGFNDTVLGQFEAENPGVKVHIVKSGDEAYYSPAAYDIDGHLTGAEKYISTADVLYVNAFNFSVEGTRASYFLDLTPLINVDSSLDTNDFFPNIWQSYQWDGGMWAMPVSASVRILAYKPAAFDEAGLAYPNENWTIDDLVTAAQALSKKDENGKVIQPGIYSVGDQSLLFRSLLGQGFYDDSVFPNAPRLSDPALAQLLTTWVELEKDGTTGRNLDFSSFDYNDVPMRVDQSYILSQPGLTGGDQWAGSLLPGGVAGMNVEGFAISGATQYPEQSYALLKFLSSNVDIVTRFFGDTPARRSLVGKQSEDTVGIGILNRSPEVEAFIQDALQKALPLSEMRFGDYISQAIDKMVNDGEDADAALQEVEASAVQNLQTAEAKHGATTVAVATIVPTPVLTAGEVSLNFGLTAFVSPLPNRDKWDEVINDFTANDPQVRQVVLDTGFGLSLADMSQKDDCYFLPYSIVQMQTDLSPILPLDPYMSADPNFDKNDVVGNTMTQLQKNDQTWAYPIIIQPQVLRYNKNLFDKAGVPAPDNGWTVDQFADAVRQLKLDPGDPPPFVPNEGGGTHLLILIAAYGGIPLDYRTDPVTLNFTDPTTVEAIRQVLDLAKNGYIKYQKLGDFGGGGGGGSSNTVPIFTQSLSMISFYSFPQDSDNPYLMTTYPSGSQYTGISYDIGTAYISSTSQNPDACYRWITTVAQHPDLFMAMPARRSQLNDAASTSPDLAAAYNQIDQILQDPNAISIPSQIGGAASSPGNFVVQLWLFRAFDSYVLEDGDLDAKLSEAQTFAEAYQGCVADIPPNTLGPDATQKEQLAYYLQYITCATNVDPSLKTLFNFAVGS
jgi:ABC-type glycerol-3-phosphate transport system substrate-binding protein